MSTHESLHHTFGKAGAYGYAFFALLIGVSFGAYYFLQYNVVAFLYYTGVIGAVVSASFMFYWWVVETDFLKT